MNDRYGFLGLEKAQLDKCPYCGAEKISSVADQLWKCNKDAGNVNSTVAGWAIEQLMESVASLNALYEKCREYVQIEKETDI